MKKTGEDCIIAVVAWDFLSKFRNSLFQDELENLKVQLENAKEEAQKEFPQEEELEEKVARLGELNVLLDMDKKDHVLLDDGEGVEIEPEQKKKERER